MPNIIFVEDWLWNDAFNNVQNITFWCTVYVT